VYQKRRSNDNISTGRRSDRHGEILDSTKVLARKSTVDGQAAMGVLRKKGADCSEETKPG
jgi:hypothetical protein